MALIRCTECGKEVRDKVVMCPHCGCPMTEILLAMKAGDAASDVKNECDSSQMDAVTVIKPPAEDDAAEETLKETVRAAAKEAA